MRIHLYSDIHHAISLRLCCAPIRFLHGARYLQFCNDDLVPVASYCLVLVYPLVPRVRIIHCLSRISGAEIGEKDEFERRNDGGD